MSQQRAPVPEPTEIAGRYQVVKKLGAGAFGTVYKAKDRILGRMVAIKTIRLEGLAAAGASLDELMDRFRREAQVSAQLKHPNIVTIYDVGEANGLSYLAMEFIDGVGLDRVIAAAGRLPIERAASLGAQVADALDFAHRNNVVHRDIKPANIMIEAGDRVKVTDFGIAKVTDSGEHLTMTGSLLGTPSYMSPEQARGATLDGRSDLFSTGCVLYEMLAGKKAFRGDSITGLIFKIITEEPPPIREFDPAIPDEMVRILAKALAKTPEMRYQTGRDMAEDLVALSRPGATPTLRQAELATAPGLRVPSTPTISASPTLHAEGPPTVHPAGATLASAGKTIQSAPATVVSRPPTPRGSPPPPPPSAAAARGAARPAPARSSTGVLVGVAVGALVLILGAGVAGWLVFGRRAPRPETAGTLAGTVGTTSAAPSTMLPATVVTAPPPTEAAAGPATSNAGGNAVAPETRGATSPTTLPAVASSGTKAAGPTSRGAANPPAATTGTTAGAPPTGTEAEATRDPRFRYLDEEAPEADGRESGERAAGAYRGRPGWNSSSGGTYGTNRRFAERERSPRNVGIMERPAVATLRHLIDREETYKRLQGRYGNFSDLVRGGGFALDVPLGPTSFRRRGYRFDLTVEEDGFKITAVPVMPGTRGSRSFMGDDSGYIRAGLE